MEYRNIEFFNVDELLPVEGLPGLRLYRYPKALAETLGEAWQHNARFRAQKVHGCEMRFVTKARCFDLVLTGYDVPTDIQIFHGDRIMQRLSLAPGVTTSIHVDVPPMEANVRPETLAGRRFGAHVWRILCGVNGYLHFHTLDTYGWPVRPPQAGEEPAVRWLAYGSSITCGHVTTLYTNSYVNQTARRLGWDVLNKGLSGSCFCEKQVADYLAQQEVDYMSLEMGVNMAPSFTAEEYEARVDYLLHKVSENPWVNRFFVIDSFPNYGWAYHDDSIPAAKNYMPFKQVTRALTKKLGDSRFVSIHGEEVLTSLENLSCDLLHPSDEGHIIMGERLAAIIASQL